MSHDPKTLKRRVTIVLILSLSAHLINPSPRGLIQLYIGFCRDSLLLDQQFNVSEFKSANEQRTYDARDHM